MPAFSIHTIATWLGIPTPTRHHVVQYFSIDSRAITNPAETIFFAIKTASGNGHLFLADLAAQGVRCFVVQQGEPLPVLPSDATILAVENVVAALQTVAAMHRQQFHYPVLAITGSNGKTVVKEWLYQLLQNKFDIVRSPKSYNSQLGVPLSLLQLNSNYNFAIIEAGISEKNEMQALANCIAPTIGLLTNIGDAHNAGFANHREKALEKLSLFTHAEVLFAPYDTLQSLEIDVRKLLGPKQYITYSLVESTESTYQITIQKQVSHSLLEIRSTNEVFKITVPFTEDASLENCISCILVGLYVGMSAMELQAGLQSLQPLAMRLQLVKGLYQSTIINDAYSNDWVSFQIALRYLKQQAAQAPTIVVLTDMLDDSLPKQERYQKVANELLQTGVQQLWFVGQDGVFLEPLVAGKITTRFFDNTAALLAGFAATQFAHSYVLIKGARKFALDALMPLVEWQQHQTVCTVNLSALAYNLQQYRQRIPAGTQIVAMIKASAYGAGSVEVAKLLAYHKVNYLAVAYADEGVALRQAGVELPIMVLNVEEASFHLLVQYRLEPELFSLPIVKAFLRYAESQQLTLFPVHIKVNTGMNRLGFDTPELPDLVALLTATNTLKVLSVFTHLVASDDDNFDAFTQQQQASFKQICEYLATQLPYTFWKHASNTGGIERGFFGTDTMVRLGIGLYGVSKYLSLHPVLSLTTTIAQIREVAAGESVGYSRAQIVTKPSKIATIRIGYADGFMRSLSNGKGFVYVEGVLAPVVGRVCMDMTMIDVTHVPNITLQSKVEIFGTHLPVTQVAEWANTIAYDVLTHIHHRVPRVYIHD